MCKVTRVCLISVVQEKIKVNKILKNSEKQTLGGGSALKLRLAVVETHSCSVLSTVFH